MNKERSEDHNEASDDDDWIDEEVWEKLTPKQRAKFKAAGKNKNNNKEDWIDPKAWELLTPEQKNKWRNNNNMFKKNDEGKKPGINATPYGKQYEKNAKKQD